MRITTKALLAAVCGLMYFGCRKIDNLPPPLNISVEEKFFYSHRSGSQQEKAIIQFLKKKKQGAALC